MKRILLGLILIVAGHTLYAQAKGQIMFVNKDSVYDFGEIIEGEDAEYHFEIKNTGDENLSIHKIKGETGNVKFQWPANPIKPGKKGTLTATYHQVDGKGTGSFYDDIVITSSATQAPYPFIHISGTVVRARSEAPKTNAAGGKGHRGRR